MKPHDCAQQGHVWREGVASPSDWNDKGRYVGQFPLYVRKRGTSGASTDVHCQHCSATTTLKAHAGFSGPRRSGQGVDRTIPPQFKRVLDAALAAAPSAPVKTQP